VIPTISSDPIYYLKDPYDDVVGIRQLIEILSLLRVQRIQQGNEVSGSGGPEGKLEKCVYILLFALNYCGHERKRLQSRCYLSGKMRADAQRIATIAKIAGTGRIG
jgi:hypothetical protein